VLCSCRHERSRPTCSCHNPSWFTAPGLRLRSGQSPSRRRSPSTTCPPCDKSQSVSDRTSQVGHRVLRPDGCPGHTQQRRALLLMSHRTNPIYEPLMCSITRRRPSPSIGEGGSGSQTQLRIVTQRSATAGIDTTVNPPESGKSPPLGVTPMNRWVASSVPTQGGRRRQLGATNVTPHRRTEVASPDA